MRNADFDQVEDFEFLLRVSLSYKIGKLEGPPLLQFRRHGAMGSLIYGAKMEILTAELIVQHLGDAAEVAAVMATAYFNASYIFRRQKCYWRAIAYAGMAIRHGPRRGCFYRNLMGALLCRQVLD